LHPALDDARVLHTAHIGRQFLSKDLNQFLDDLSEWGLDGAPVRRQIGSS
jgi:hypothetical protein